MLSNQHQNMSSMLRGSITRSLSLATQNFRFNNFAMFSPSIKTLDIRQPRTLLLLAWLIFAAALGLRSYNIGQYPPRHATDDEFHYLWAGLNFWESGQPMAWSGLAGSNLLGVASIDQMGYFIVAPALDHPPLFTLTIGALAKLTNPHRIVQLTRERNLVTIWDVDLARARLFMLPLFAASFWLLFAIVRPVFPPATTLLTLFIYGFMSHAVTQGRLILADNLSTVWLLASVYFLQSWQLGRRSYRVMAAGVILTTAAAILTKVPAACQVPVLIAYLFYIKRPREIWTVVAGFLLGALLYFGWISWFGLDGFLRIMAAQAARFRGFNAFQLVSGVPRLLDQVDFNGVIIAAWFCAIVQVMRPRTSPLMLIVPVYMLAFTFFAGDVMFGWYSLSLFPWLALALAVTTAQVYRRPRMGPVIGWMLLLLPYCFQTLFYGHSGSMMGLRYSYVAAVAALVVCFALSPGRYARVIRAAMIAVLALVFLREVSEVLFERTDRTPDPDPVAELQKNRAN
jgi:hypothetical protein